MKKIVVLSGAGISAESGIQTFRDAGGLWEGHDVMEVASPQGWNTNKELVLDFYNKRRKQLLEVKPNKAHFEIANLQSEFDLSIITQNVDDLHERAGSRNVIHIHGELLKVRSVVNPKIVLPWTKDLLITDTCQYGLTLRPDIVWFGEAVPLMDKASKEVASADIILIIGTSLQVYPAAGLIDFADSKTIIYYVDPKADQTSIPYGKEVICINEKATKGIDVFIKYISDQ